MSELPHDVLIAPPCVGGCGLLHGWCAIASRVDRTIVAVPGLCRLAGGLVAVSLGCGRCRLVRHLGGDALYAGLLGLGLYMLWRGARAWMRLCTQGSGWRPRYIDDVGFTLISLFDGFVIVGAMDLGAQVAWSSSWGRPGSRLASWPCAVSKRQ
jgi:hypothetical protein